jgi:tRNA(Ile)-lysidine synthase
MQRATSKVRQEPTERERLRRRTELSADRFAGKEGVWPADGRILVGVSGGPDSTALAMILGALRRRRGLELTLAYMDHQLRGVAEAGEEVSAVLALASRLGVALVRGRADVRGEARGLKRSLEEAARRARYDFLASTAADLGIATVAVGHTLDDQAETVLMHLIRGSGLAGLGGMRPKSNWPTPGHRGLLLIRPLLNTTRNATEAYCRAAGAEWVEDASNRSPDFLRNRVRLELVPLLKDYNPRIREALGRLAEASRGDLDALQAIAGEAIVEKAGATEIDRRRLRAMPGPLRLHAVRLAFLRLLGDLQGIGERHVIAVAAAAAAAGSGQALDLPRAVHARVGRDAVRLTIGKAQTRQASTEVRLRVPGRTVWGETVVAAGGDAIEDAEAQVAVDAKAVGDCLRVRSWRPGDRMRPAGMEGTKKLQDIFVDGHVPREERSTVPVFETDTGIVWVGGIRLSEQARPRDGAPTVTLSYRRGAGS